MKETNKKGYILFFRDFWDGTWWRVDYSNSPSPQTSPGSVSTDWPPTWAQPSSSTPCSSGKDWPSSYPSTMWVDLTHLLFITFPYPWLKLATRINHNSNTCICPNVDLWKIKSYMTAVTRIVCMNLQLPNTSQMRRLRIMAHSIKGLTFVTAISGKYVQLICP